MIKKIENSFALCSIVFLFSGLGLNAEAPLSVRPEIQTAEWAVEWWGPRHVKKLEEIKSRPIDLLMIGDSIKHGWENKGRKTWQKFYSHRNAINLGFSGDRTEHVLWRLQNGAVGGVSPKLAVIMIGTNNTGHRKDPAIETALGIKEIVSELRTRLPSTRILLLAVFPRGTHIEDVERKINNQVNNIISTFSNGKTVFYLNVNDVFLDKNGVLSKQIMPDLLHPNSKGYEMWANAMESTIVRLMRKNINQPTRRKFR
jgi:lysophospholipase L1-like esterase